MNCDQASEKLIDLVYGELAAAEAQAVRRHVEVCQHCRGELDNLQFSRRALARYRAGEPASAVANLPADNKGKGQILTLRPRVRRIAAICAGAAAALLVATSLWMLYRETSKPVYADTGPPEIRRLGVSLTILSQPENRRGAPVRQMVQQKIQQRDLQGRYHYGSWSGLALVRDQRIVRRLKSGVTEIAFTGVPSGIIPDSVRLRSLDAPGGLTVLEQNYQYDLATASAVLKRYIDKPLTVTFKDGKAASGVLMSFDGRTLVIRPPGQGPRNVAREQIRSIAFEKLPEGLLATPTLMWQLRNNAARKQNFEVAYLTGGLTWRADYVLKLRPAQNMPAGELPEIIDTADLVGYATVTNNSGVTYEDAELKLMAGDVNLITPVKFSKYITEGNILDESNTPDTPQFAEKSFFEYHLYTLGRPTTIRSAETKQIELISGSGIGLKRGYVYDPTANVTCARVVSEMKNSEANGLGKPLPKGVIRLYAPDPEGVDTYVAQTTIDHTPKDETIRLKWGYAFDIACEYTLLDERHERGEHHEKCSYEIRNHKASDVTVTIIARMDPSTHTANCTIDGVDYPWHVREVGVVEIAVPVKADETVRVIFTHSYNHHSGGGLKSPYDN